MRYRHSVRGGDTVGIIRFDDCGEKIKFPLTYTVLYNITYCYYNIIV